MGYNRPTKIMGTSDVSTIEGFIKNEQNIIADLQRELKSINTTKVRKESIRRQIAQHKEQLARRKEELRRAKAAAKKK